MWQLVKEHEWVGDWSLPRGLRPQEVLIDTSRPAAWDWFHALTQNGLPISYSRFHPGFWEWLGHLSVQVIYIWWVLPRNSQPIRGDSHPVEMLNAQLFCLWACLNKHWVLAVIVCMCLSPVWLCTSYLVCVSIQAFAGCSCVCDLIRYMGLSWTKTLKSSNNPLSHLSCSAV